MGDYRATVCLHLPSGTFVSLRGDTVRIVELRGRIPSLGLLPFDRSRGRRRGRRHRSHRRRLICPRIALPDLTRPRFIPVDLKV